MLCPEVWKFLPPKIIESKRNNEDLESVTNVVNTNCFYKSVIIACPDELQPPSFIQKIILEDTDYYKLLNCSLTEFIEPAFVESFVKIGKIYCISSDRNCIIQNCAAITPDGILTIHVLEYIYQTLGLEGIKRPHNYYEVKIDLKKIKVSKNIKSGLQKLGLFNFFIIWEPYNEEICPSSLAKYFDNRNIAVSVHTYNVKNITPIISKIPSLKDVDIEEIVEWIGILAHEADLNQKEPYISLYSQPDSENALESTRLSIYTIKGFIPPSIICTLCEKLNEFVISRETENYWASISLQSDENSLWQWNTSSSRMFQAHDSTSNLFFTQQGNHIYSIGQLKYT